MDFRNLGFGLGKGKKMEGGIMEKGGVERKGGGGGKKRSGKGKRGGGGNGFVFVKIEDEDSEIKRERGKERGKGGTWRCGEKNICIYMFFFSFLVSFEPQSQRTRRFAGMGFLHTFTLTINSSSTEDFDRVFGVNVARAAPYCCGAYEIPGWLKLVKTNNHKRKLHRTIRAYYDKRAN